MASASKPTATSESKPTAALQFRWVMVYLLFGCRLVCQANRILLGALMPMIKGELGLDRSQTGQLLAAFASGYVLTQVLGGALADRLGGKWILLVAIIAVTSGSLVAPLTVTLGMWPAYWTYFFMGLCEGPSFPTSGSMLSKWIPAKEKATAASLADTGGSIGGLLALGGGPVLAAWVGWRATFWTFGGASALFCLCWAVFGANDPTGSTWVSEAELALLRAEGVIAPKSKEQAQGVKASSALPLRLFLRPPVLAVCYAHAVFNFGRYFLYAWIPSFYSEELGVAAVTAGFYMTCLQVTDAFMKLAVAPVADSLVASGRMTTLGIRRMLSCSGFVGFGAGLGLCAVCPGAGSVTLALVVAKGFASCHAAGFKTNYLELSRRHTGSLSGIGNTLATASSMVAPMIAGDIIKSHGWEGMFALCFVVNLSGALVFGLFSSATCLDDEEGKSSEDKKK